MSSEPRPVLQEAPIPLCAPHISGNAWRYVKECLDTEWVSSAGPFVNRFERMVADMVGRRHAIATVNGTSALHIALLVAGVRPDDEVLVSTLTFIAPANAIRYTGAWPVFIDAEPRYWQMDVEQVVRFVRERCAFRDGELRNLRTGRRVRAVLPVHILGHPVDMAPLCEIARELRLAVVEDSTESLGAAYRGTPAGALGDAACFSFNGNKMITTGGGGMIVTDRDDWAERARYLTTQAKDRPDEYIHSLIGYNYRLTNLQAALGCAQLERFEEHLAAKRRIAAGYTEQLRGVPGISLMQESPAVRAAFWMYTIGVDEAIFGSSSRDIVRQLREKGIESRPLWQPLHMSPAHDATASLPCPVAEELYRRGISLPSSVGLADSGVRRVSRLIAQLAAARPGPR